MSDVSGEARDLHGRWVAAGKPEPNIDDIDPTNQARHDAIRMYGQTAAQTAVRLGFDPKDMTVTDKDYEFTLNGQKHFAGGSHKDGKVTLYANRLSFNTTPEVTTHEIEHAKFQALLDEHAKEHATIMALPRSGGPRDDVMKPDGSLREPYDKQFPVYTAYHNITEGNFEQMAKEDGCTPYSKEWWDAQGAGTATLRQAFHETLAEMAAIRSRTGFSPTAGPPTAVWHTDLPGDTPGSTKGGYLLKSETSPRWNALYDLVEDNWKKNHVK